MRGQTRRSPVLVQGAVSEDPRWTRAVGDHLACPQGEKLEERWSLDVRSQGQPWPLPRERYIKNWEVLV